MLDVEEYTLPDSAWQPPTATWTGAALTPAGGPELVVRYDRSPELVTGTEFFHGSWDFVRDGVAAGLFVPGRSAPALDAGRAVEPRDPLPAPGRSGLWLHPPRARRLPATRPKPQQPLHLRADRGALRRAAPLRHARRPSGPASSRRRRARPAPRRSPARISSPPSARPPSAWSPTCACGCRGGLVARGERRAEPVAPSRLRRSGAALGAGDRAQRGARRGLPPAARRLRAGDPRAGGGGGVVRGGGRAGARRTARRTAVPRRAPRRRRSRRPASGRCHAITRWRRSRSGGRSAVVYAPRAGLGTGRCARRRSRWTPAACTRCASARGPTAR